MIITLTRTLTWLLYCYQTSGTLALLNSCILCTHVPCTVTLVNSTVIPTSGRASWCRNDEDVSHDRASVRRFLNGTKCHTEQSATPYTWWGPPLESVGATSRIYFPHRAKCHTTHVVGATSWIHGGHLLNLWGYLLNQPSEQSATWSKVPHHTRGGGPPLESVGLLPPSCLCRLVLVWYAFSVHINAHIPV